MHIRMYTFDLNAIFLEEFGGFLEAHCRVVDCDSPNVAPFGKRKQAVGHCPANFGDRSPANIVALVHEAQEPSVAPVFAVKGWNDHRLGGGPPSIPVRRTSQLFH